jgi:hypothetical protein
LSAVQGLACAGTAKKAHKAAANIHFIAQPRFSAILTGRGAPFQPAFPWRLGEPMPAMRWARKNHTTPF